MWNPATDAAYQIVLWNTAFVVPISDPPPTVQAEWFRILYPVSTCSGCSAQWLAPSLSSSRMAGHCGACFPAWINWPSIQSPISVHGTDSLKDCFMQTGALCECLQLVNTIYLQHSQCRETRNWNSYAFFVVQTGKQEDVEGLKGAVIPVCPFTCFVSETLKFRWICGGLFISYIFSYNQQMHNYIIKVYIATVSLCNL